jgi:DNA-binding CsgD family transcriptional regulator
VALQTTGQLAEAFAAAEEAAEAAMVCGSGAQQAAALSLRCCLAAWTGDTQAAGAAAAAAAERLPRPARGPLAVLAARALAEARLTMGDAHGCVAVATPMIAAQPDADGGPWAPVGWHEPGAWYELLTRAELAEGHLAAAARWAAAAADAARHPSVPGHTGLARLARAQAITPIDVRAGYELAVAACDALSAAGMVVDAARATLAAAVALAACGDTDQAFAEAGAAQSVFQSCGATSFARSAAALRRRIAARGARGSNHNGAAANRLRRSGSPGSRSPGNGSPGIESSGNGAPGNGSAGYGSPGYGAAGYSSAGNGAVPAQTLTRRQQQVAALLSQGMTNRRIAQQLHVTDKTVEMHLSNIFAKLGVSSRTEAAAALIRADRT